MNNRKAKLSQENKLSIYKVIFHIILLYGAEIWSECAVTHLEELQFKQNKILRLLLDKPFHRTIAVKRRSFFLHNCQNESNPLIRYIVDRSIKLSILYLGLSLG